MWLGHRVTKTAFLLISILFVFESSAQFSMTTFFKSRKLPLTFTTSPQTVPAGVCSGVTIVSAPAVVLAPVIVDLTANGSVQFFSDMNCLSPIASVTIGIGLQSANFYFLEATSGSRTITGTNAGYANANQNQTISVNNFVWTGGGGNALWSTGANWSGGVAPTVSNVALFNSTCVSNCSPQISAPVDVLGIRIENGYSGTITQASGQTLITRASGFVMKSGTFVGGTANIEVRSLGGFQLRGGTFTSTTASLFVGSAIDANANLFYVDPVLATFNHNNGTVHLRANGVPCPGHTYSVNVPINFNFWNLTLATQLSGCGSAQFWTFNGATVNVLNDLVDSRIYAELNDVTINLFGNLSTNSISLRGGNGLIRFVGTANQTYTGGNSNLDYKLANVEIFKPISGTVTPTNSNSIGFRSLNLSAGSFTAPSSTLHLVGGVTANITALTITPGTTFNSNGGTISFNGTRGTCDLYTYLIDVPDEQNFHSFAFNSVGGSGCGATQIMTLVPGRKVILQGSITSNFGRLNGTFEFNGNLNIGGGNGGGTANLRAIGAAEQLVTLTSGNFPSGGLTVDKGGTNRVVLMSNVSQATHTWNLVSGRIYMGGFNLTLQGLTLNGNTIHKRIVAGTGSSGTLTVGGSPIANGSFLGGTVAD